MRDPLCVPRSFRIESVTDATWDYKPKEREIALAQIARSTAWLLACASLARAGPNVSLPRRTVIGSQLDGRDGWRLNWLIVRSLT